MNSHYPHPARSTVRIAVRRREQTTEQLQRLLATSMMSAITLGALLMAKADTWVTVNPDGTTTRTEVTTPSSQYAPQERPPYSNQLPVGYSTVPGGYNGLDQPVYSNSLGAPSVAPGTPPANTSFFAGSFYPLPSYVYSYPTPGYNYPVGPIYPRVPPPVVTTLPSTAYGYGYGYGYNPPYCGPAAPFQMYSYPNYAGSGIYYSGPAGGGGTIYSQTTTSGNGLGVSFGNNGWNVNMGNTTRTQRSTTTVTTHSHR